MFRRIFFGTAITSSALVGAYHVTDTPSQPPWLRKQRVVIRGYTRFVNTVRAGLSVSLDYKISTWNLPDDDSPEVQAVWDRCHERSVKRIVETTLDNGGMYVKLGQTFAAMNHMLPKVYIDGLAALQDRARTQGMNEVRQTFLEEFGKLPEEIFVVFEPHPIGAASLAQVHKAVTKDGQEVAVKVQFADLSDRFDADIKTLTVLLDLVTFIHPTFSFGWALNDLRGSLLEELDFVHEGKNSEKCLEQLKDINGFYVPKVRWDLTNKRILTTEFIRGCKVNDLEAIKKMGLKPADVMTTVLEAFGRQIFCTGFLHADPHPANLLVRKKQNGSHEVVLIDHGLYMQLDENTREIFANIWKAVVMKDQKALIEHCKRFNVPDHNLFVSMILQRPYGVNSADLSDVMKRTKGEHINEEEHKKMQAQAQHRMDDIVDTLKQLPRCMLMVIRSMNLVRALSFDLGAPVDRFSLLAKSALRGIREQSNGSVTENCLKFTEEVWFSFNLRLLSFQFYMQGLFFRTLLALRLINPSPEHEQYLLA